MCWTLPPQASSLLVVKLFPCTPLTSVLESPYSRGWECHTILSNGHKTPPPPPPRCFLSACPHLSRPACINSTLTPCGAEPLTLNKYKSPPTHGQLLCTCESHPPTVSQRAGASVGPHVRRPCTWQYCCVQSYWRPNPHSVPGKTPKIQTTRAKTRIRAICPTRHSITLGATHSNSTLHHTALSSLNNQSHCSSRSPDLHFPSSLPFNSIV